MDWKERGDVRRFCTQLRAWVSCEVDSKDLCTRLEDVGELEGHERERNWLGKDMGEWELAYCSEGRKNKEATVAGKLMVVNFYHEQWEGLSLPLQHFRIKAVEKEIKRAHAGARNLARVKKSLTWEMIRVMEESIGEWG